MFLSDCYGRITSALDRFMSRLLLLSRIFKAIKFRTEQFRKEGFAMSNINPPRCSALRMLAMVTGLCILFSAASVLAQTTISTGSIVGTVTDPSNAVVGGAKVLITNKGTNQVVTTTTTSSGAFNSGS